MENIGTGLMLMVVGMALVFVILLIVIWLSQFLIKVVNKIAPEEEVKKETCCQRSFYGCWSNGCHQVGCEYSYSRQGPGYQDREIITILKIRKTHYLLQWKKK